MTDTMTHAGTDDPAAIERDIRRTQDDMSRTVDRIGEQLTVKNVFNALLDKADENGVDARMLVDGARRNPIALGLIAAGAIWLVSDKDSKFPSMPKHKEPKTLDLDESDIHHRDYVSHMSTVQMREGEDPAAYQRRRDLARSTFFMVERGHDEDEHSFRQRLDDVADRFREKRRAWADSSADTAAAAKQKTQMAAGKAQDFYASNPLVGGIVAAAIGATLGSALPVTRTEKEKLAPLGNKARDMIDEHKEEVTSKLREKKDELLDRADQKLQSTQGGSSREERPEAPFIIGDRQR